MRLVVRLDAANPHHNWQMSTTPSSPRHQQTGVSVSSSPRPFSQRLTNGGGTSFSVDERDDDVAINFVDVDSNRISMTDQQQDFNNNNNEPFLQQDSQQQSRMVTTIRIDNNKEQNNNNNNRQLQNGRRHHYNNYHHIRANSHDVMSEHIRDVLDPSYKEDKSAGFGLSVDGPAIIITPSDKRVVQHNRQSTRVLAGNVDHLNASMRHQINNIRHEQKVAHDDLVRIAQRPPRQLPSMQPEQEHLRGRVVNFVTSETEAQESGREPVLGEFLDQLQQMASLRQNKLYRESAFSSDNPPPGIGANFDGSYININGIGGATVTPPDYSVMPTNWQMPSWVMRQGYNLKQQMLLHKAQQQLTPILKSQPMIRQQVGAPIIIKQTGRSKSPSTKRVSWSERVDAIAIPVQTSGDKPLRKPGRRQRSISPRRNNQSAEDGDPQQQDDSDFIVSTDRRSPRPGSSEAAILDRLSQHDELTTKRVIITNNNNNNSRHRHVARLSNNARGGNVGNNSGTMTPSSLSLSLSNSYHNNSSATSTLATTPMMGGGIFGAFPASDDALIRSSRSMLRSALRLSNTKDDVAALRRWRSLEAVLQRRNMSQHFAQIRHRAHVTGATPASSNTLVNNNRGAGLVTNNKPLSGNGRNTISPSPSSTGSQMYVSSNNSNNSNTMMNQPPLGGAQMKLLQRQSSLSNTTQQAQLINNTNNRHQSPAPQPTLVINNSIMTMAPGSLVPPPQTPPVNLLRVSKVDQDSYHVSLGIRLSNNASTTSLNSIGGTPAGTTTGYHHHPATSSNNIVIGGGGSFITTAISAAVGR